MEASKTVHSIQYLRGIAALLVVIFHLTSRIPAYDYGPLASLNLGGGVDIFFVISGFIMTVTSRRSSPLQFVKRRIIRIVPLYWILTMLLAAAVIFAPQIFRVTNFKMAYVVKSLLFIPYTTPEHPQNWAPPLLNPGWSLNMEMFFYAIFAAVLWLPERFRVAIVGAVFGLVMLCAFLPLPPELVFYTSGRVVAFWLGMVIASLYLNGKLLPKYGAMLAVLYGFAVLLAVATPAGTTFQDIVYSAIPSAAIVYGSVSLERELPRLRFLNEVGDASYSLYLTHIFTLGIATTIWLKFGFGGAIGFAAFSLPLSILVAFVTYRLIEKPFTTLGHRVIPAPLPP